MFVKTADDIGRLVREARIRAGMSQTALASRFGTTQSWISEIENGKETAEIGRILKVLAYLGLRLDLSDAWAANPAKTTARHDDSFDDYPDIDEIVASEGSKP